MKLLLATLLITFGLGNEAFALTITCKSLNTFDREVYEGRANHLVLAGGAEYDCETKNGERLDIGLAGAGPGLRFDVGNVVKISCPFISEKKLMKRLEAKENFVVFGPEADIGALIGAKLGFYMNHRGGICALTGAGLGLGASASINALVISKQSGPGSQTQRQRTPRALQIFEW